MGLLESAVELVVEDVVGVVISPPVLAIGALLAAPVVVPRMSKELRPWTKKVVKGGIRAVDKGKEMFVEIGEQWSDIVAESRAELATAEAAAMAPATVVEAKEAEAAEVLEDAKPPQPKRGKREPATTD